MEAGPHGLNGVTVVPAVAMALRLGLAAVLILLQCLVARTVKETQKK